MVFLVPVLALLFFEVDQLVYAGRAGLENCKRLKLSLAAVREVARVVER